LRQDGRFGNALRTRRFDPKQALVAARQAERCEGREARVSQLNFALREP
jgi:hypothetical protein